MGTRVGIVSEQLSARDFCKKEKTDAKVSVGVSGFQSLCYWVANYSVTIVSEQLFARDFCKKTDAKVFVSGWRTLC